MLELKSYLDKPVQPPPKLKKPDKSKKKKKPKKEKPKNVLVDKLTFRRPFTRISFSAVFLGTSEHASKTQST